MQNLSGVKKVQEIMTSDELVVYDKPKGGREKTIVLESDREYIVPEYQREIKWSTENVQVLIDDLRKGSKFLGTITLSTSEPGKFEIIDGQQRLTVITLLIKCLNEEISESKQIKNLCKIYNQSFQCFEEALAKNFNYEEIKQENLPLYNKIIESDIQNQRDILAELWTSIVERINLLEVEEREKLLLALCESELNVVINEIEGTDTQRKFCADYFIDINNKRVELDSLDIIRAYAFKEDFSNTTERWVKLQRRCNRLSNTVKYTRKELFYQYFICNVNKEINYSISKLSNDYKIKENVEFSGKKYASGTYIWNLFKNDKYYSNLLVELDEYLDFIDIVIQSETGGNDRFKSYFCDEDGNRVDEARILNAHTVINVILRNDDMVPKMMVMKYFLEVLRPSKVKQKKYKIISYINIIATIFTLSTKRKGSEIIASKLMQENWQKEIREYAIRVFQDIPGEIGYSKVIREKGIITIDSGLHAARRYLSMTDACKFESNNLSIKEDIFRNRNITSGETSMEHFFINRNCSYTLYMEDGNTVDVEILLPRKFKKYIATISNYLILDKKINEKLKNRPVYEKIDMLEEHITEKGIDAVIPSITSQKHYYLIKKIMHDESKYPKKNLDTETQKKKKRDALRKYYVNHFYDEYMILTRGLCNIDMYFIAEAEYKLKQEGFSLKEGQYTIEHDSVFSNVVAEIDEKKKQVFMSAELFNPFYKEENDSEEYAELVERTYNLFTSYLGTEPSIRSSLEYSECEDESFSFILPIKPNNADIKKYLAVLSDISSQIV